MAQISATEKHPISPTITSACSVSSFSPSKIASENKGPRAMGRVSICVAFLAALILLVSAKKSRDVTDLQIGVKYKPETCSIQAHKGDRVKVHYQGMLTDGSVFDSSFERGDPIEFELGSGQVIKGWDQGLLGMCVGEKRKLKIPAKLGYGAQGSPPKIPGGATLIFDTELVAVNGRPSTGDKKIEGEEDFGDEDL